MAKRSLLKLGIKGFSLIEVMIALAIFAVFIAAYMTTQGFNISSSATLKEEILMRDLAEQVINEITLLPPQFDEALTLKTETKPFKEWPDYNYSIKYKKIVLPDYTKLQDSEADQESEMAQIEKKIYETVKENMEKILWQTEITIKNTLTNQEFSLSAWLYNHQAEVKINAF